MQRSDVGRIAEMRGSLLEILTSVLECEHAVHALGDTEWCETHDIELDSHYCALVQYVAERLIKSGIGHVPTALHQAADALADLHEGEHARRSDGYSKPWNPHDAGWLDGLERGEYLIRSRAAAATEGQS